MQRCRTHFHLAVMGLLSSALSGCYTLNRLEDIGDVPKVTPIKDPTKLPNYHPVTMPMPGPQTDEAHVNSLWRPGARGFFKDQRAKRVGDILTVVVNIQEDKAEFKNETSRNRQTSENFSVNSFMGYESKIEKVLPEGVDPSKLIGLTNKPSHEGAGEIKRKETIKFNLAATIVQVLPNGNYVISGRQEMRVNFDIRELHLTGIVRPEDISSSNTIPLEKIAEARTVYGGRGSTMDMQQPPYGQQVLNLLSPF